MGGLYNWVQDSFNLSDKQVMPYRHLDEHILYTVFKNKFQLPETDLLRCIAKHRGHPFLKVDSLIIDTNFLKTLNAKEYQQKRILPLYQDNDHLCIAVDHPYNLHCKSLNNKPGTKKHKLVYITSAEMSHFWAHHRLKETAQNQTLLDRIIQDAIERQASDIHLTCSQKNASLFFRINGQLYPQPKLSPKDAKKLQNLITYHGHLSGDTIKKPQDGHLHYSHGGRQFDLRVSVFPTIEGSAFVLRLFHNSSKTFTLKDLGLSKTVLEKVRPLLDLDHGLILVTGPTGSGKTTTLYSLISELKSRNREPILTIEDPVEHQVDGIRQSPLNPEIDYTHKDALKAALRQDPDVIMIGEIRDEDTLKTVIDAAYTGHLVLCSLHSHDCETTLHRLKSLNADPFLLANALKGILSQKLIPKRCTHCKYPNKDPNIPIKNSGCEQCHYTGTNGRQIITEFIRLETFTDTDFLHTFETLKVKNPFISFKDDIRDKQYSGVI
ncbi:hypothetical protein DID77_00965 [Candidatus Marinamargulisbacteria bacterium SCGC AG-439-L15]|nr:hypothetical protein DID77_00965 [Candidatus Marinamargulisbacteria bacterium SCGC AG-439-L15]